MRVQVDTPASRASWYWESCIVEWRPSSTHHRTASAASFPCARQTPEKARFIMTTREGKPRGYFAKLLDTPKKGIDHSEIPRTGSTDWGASEILLPFTAGEFQTIKRFTRE